MIFWLVSRISGVVPALKSALRWACLHPATAAALVFAVLWRVEAHEHATCTRAREQAVNALKQAVAASQQAKAAYEQRSKDNADASDRSHTAIADAGRVAVAAYIATHRLPARSATTAPGGENNGPAVPQDAPALPVVALSEADVKACDESYTYALSAFQWAQTIGDN